MKHLVVTLEHGDEDRLEFYQTNEYKNQTQGKWEIQKTSSGECVYLKPHGCGIYDERPHACLTFDCRTFAKRDFSQIPPENVSFGQIEKIKAASRAATMRDKCSCARRFNDMLRG